MLYRGRFRWIQQFRGVRVRRLKILFLSALVVAAVLHFGSIFLFSNDEQHQAAQNFIAKDPRVIAALGQIESSSLRRYVAVRGSDTHGPYRLYDFMVRGQKGKARISVRVTPQAQSRFLYTVESIDR